MVFRSCNIESMWVFKYVSIQVCDYAEVSIQIPRYASMQRRLNLNKDDTLLIRINLLRRYL